MADATFLPVSVETGRAGNIEPIPAGGGEGARVYGPSAFGGDVRRFVELTLTLARTEFKLRYFGSALGYLWSLMRPLLFFGVIYVVFTNVFKLGKGIPHYPVYLLTGDRALDLLRRGDDGIGSRVSSRARRCFGRFASRAW